jgi:hypothetical protein
LGARSGSKRSAMPRMLCLQGSPDATEQYIAVMNAIFAAQVVILLPSACTHWVSCIAIKIIPGKTRFCMLYEFLVGT